MNAKKRIGHVLAARRVALLAIVTLVVACSDSEARSVESVATAAAALTPEQQAVLGFERPTADWSSPGRTLSESTTVTQGAKALGIVVPGWTEITSIAMSSLGPVKNALSVDLRPPATPSWGEVRVVLLAPSMGLSYTDLGGRSIAGLSGGAYHTLTFSLPPTVESALEGVYSDLRIRLVLNAPASSAPYLIDNIDVADSSGGEPPPGTVAEFSVVIPDGQTRQSMLLSASEGLAGADRVELASTGQMAGVANLGSTLSQFGAALKGHTNIFSVGNVKLLSQSIVDGFVRTGGIIDKQDNSVRILGLEQPGTAVPARTVSWAVEFPSSPVGVSTVMSNATVTLAPGAYRNLNIQNGRVYLQAGTYFFDSINVEPQGRIIINNPSGTVFVYVKNSLTMHGPLVDTGPRHGQVLFGYLGTSVADLGEPFVGTLVAPNAAIELHRPSTAGTHHRGSWFGKRIQVFSDCHLFWLPFDWSTVPGPPESCTSDDECSDGRVCWLEQGPRFNLPHGSSVCINAACLASPTPDCGTVSSPCGRCSNDPRACSGTDCRPGESCGMNNGSQFAAPGQRFCWDQRCSDPVFAQANCGEISSPCGSCDPIGVACATGTECTGGQICRAGTCVNPDCLSAPQLLGCGYPGARCGPCTTAPTCETDSDCGQGSFCPRESNGELFGTPGVSYCVEDGGCVETCSNRQCGDANVSNGCGGRCNALCVDRDPRGCHADADCHPGSACIQGGGPRVGLAQGTNVCLPISCQTPGLRAPECGTVDSVCGLCPPEPSIECYERVCGVDPATGAQCGGACPTGQTCTPLGQCAPVASTPPVLVTNPDGSSRPVAPSTSPLPANGFGAIAAEFSVSERGSASYVIPIDVPPGRAGMQPQLAFRYNSSTGNGALGVGWSIDGFPAISRCPRTYAQDGFTQPILDSDGSYDEALCLDGQRLVEVPGKPFEYRTEIDTFAKIVAGGFETTDHFRAYTKDGRILWFGGNPEAEEIPRGRHMVRAFLLTGIQDRFGNQITIRYRSSSYYNGGTSGFHERRLQLLPDSISYTDHFGDVFRSGDRTIKFHYGDDRPDKLMAHQSGGDLARTLRLDRVEISAAHQPVRNYFLQYEIAPNGLTRMTSLRECNGSGTTCKAPTTFTYFDERGFQELRRYPLRWNPNETYTPWDIWPLGTVVRRGNGFPIAYDALAGINAYGTAYVTTPIPGGAEVAMSALPPPAGLILSGMTQAINFFGAKRRVDTIYSPWMVSLAGPSWSSERREDRICNDRKAMPREHVLRTMEGDDGFYDTCPTTFTKSDGTVVHYQRREWFLDVDGDGVQDKLYCAENGQLSDRMAYKLARGGGRAQDGNVCGAGWRCRSQRRSVQSGLPAFAGTRSALCGNRTADGPHVRRERRRCDRARLSRVDHEFRRQSRLAGAGLRCFGAALAHIERSRGERGPPWLLCDHPRYQRRWAAGYSRSPPACLPRRRSSLPIGPGARVRTRALRRSRGGLERATTTTLPLD